ncbi:MAG: erythromycin esterase family protein [Gammaproteobacteria bacterium]
MNIPSKMFEKLLVLLEKHLIPCNIHDPCFCEKISNLIGDARIVLMGEATHGTVEFYQARMALSEYLIREKGFHAIALEGDWAPVHAIHRYCKHHDKVRSPEAALEGFKRFPVWMWRNTAMLDFIKKIRKNNPISFYGLDLYGLNDSMQAVSDYFKQYHPTEAKKVMQRYACLDNVSVSPQMYSYLIEQKLKKSCVKEVTAQFIETQRIISQHIFLNPNEKENQFCALQNARVVQNAENYYRTLLEHSSITWNIRDRHMADTLHNIMAYLEDIHRVPAKVIVWAHNSHVGDARATEMSERQEINLGQLVRERFHTSSFLLGFSTAEGHVTAATAWDGLAEHKVVRSPIQGSYESLFHAAKEKNFIVNLRTDTPLTHLLKSPQLQRAIGVIYRPEAERISHYYFSRLPYQFDAIVHLDKTNSIVPLEDS